MGSGFPVGRTWRSAGALASVLIAVALIAAALAVITPGAAYADEADGGGGGESIYAILYADGDFVFQVGNVADPEKGEVLGRWTDLLDTQFDMKANKFPKWHDQHSLIKRAVVADAFAPSSLNTWFAGMENLESVDLAKLDMSRVESTRYMFYGCESLAEMDVASWDTPALQRADCMFERCKSLVKVSITSWKAPKLRLTNSMFFLCTSLRSLDLSGFEAPGIEYMAWMFGGCASLESLGIGALGNASMQSPDYDVQGAFEGCYDLRELVLGPDFKLASDCGLSGREDWSGPNGHTLSLNDLVEQYDGSTMAGRWWYDGEMLDVRTPDPEVAAPVDALIAELPSADDLTLDDAEALKAAEDAYDRLTLVQKVYVSRSGELFDLLDRYYQLKDSYEYDKDEAEMVDEYIDDLPAVDDLTSSDASNVWAARYYYNHLTRAQQSYVKKLAKLEAAEARIAELVGSDEDKPTLFYAVLYEDGTLVLQPTDAPESSRGTVRETWQCRVDCNINEAPWQKAPDAVKAIEAKVGSKAPSSMRGWFADCKKLVSVDLSQMSFDDVRDMYGVFRDCGSLEAVSLSGMDAPRLGSFMSSFSGCSSLVSVDLTGVDTPALRDISYMFSMCVSLSSVDLSDLDTGLVENMELMFQHCKRLESVNLAGFDTSSVTDMRSMFIGCNALKRLDLSMFTTKNVTSMTYMLGYYDTALRELKIGAQFAFKSTSALPEIPKDSVYTGKWLSPAGVELTSGELAACYDGSTMAGTYRAQLRPDAAGVDALIAALPSADAVTLDDAEAVRGARDDYDALVARGDDATEVKLLGRLEELEEVLRGLEAEAEAHNASEAARVTALISDLPKSSKLTLDDANAVAAARSAYDALTDVQKGLVTNVDTLETLEKKIKTLANKAAAAEVDALIAGLPSPEELTPEGIESVKQARAAYESLTKTQKKYVTLLGSLEGLEEVVAGIEAEKAAAAVNALIAALPSADELSLDDAEAVAEVRAAYDALTALQEGYVNNLDKLEGLEDRLLDLKADVQAAAVDALIEALPSADSITFEDVEAIRDARNEYAALIAGGRHVEVKLLGRLEELEGVVRDWEAEASRVDALIAGLPKSSKLTLDNADAVAEARAAYEALTDAQKGFVSKLTTLEALEKRITTFANKAAAAEVDALIENLCPSGYVAREDIELVKQARAAYEALTKTQKKYVEQLERLEELEEEVYELEVEIAAEAVDVLIAALPSYGDLKLSDAASVAEARAAYDALTFDQQEHVWGIGRLEELEERLDELEVEEPAAAVDALIAALPPYGKLTLGDATAVAKARAAYDALTPWQQEYVEGASLLEDLEERLAELGRPDISKATVTGLGSKTYAGKSLAPAPAVTLGGKKLAAKTDYTVAYKDAKGAAVKAADVKAAGSYQVVITGRGAYKGSITKAFTISKANASSLSVAKVSAKTYAGKAIAPAPSVKLSGTALKKGIDYTLSYRNNVKAGTATITVKGKGSVTGTKTATFKIAKAPASKLTVAKVADQKYTGKAIKPSPVVKFAGKKLKKGTDYTLAYKSNVRAGTATVTVKGKGNFTGSKAVKFKIVKPKSSKVRAAAVRL